MSTEYILDIRTKNNDSKRIPINGGPITIGSDNSAEVCLKNEELSPLHLKFRLQDEILTINQLGVDDSSKLGRQKLKQGKMYIIDKGDKITFGSVKVIIRKEKIEEVKQNVSNTEEEKTDEIEVNENLQQKEEKEETGKGEISSIVRRAALKRNAFNKALKKTAVKYDGHLLPGLIVRLTSHLISILIAFSILTFVFDYYNFVDDVDKLVVTYQPELTKLIQKVHLKIIQLVKLSPQPLPFEIPGPEKLDLTFLSKNALYLKIFLVYILFQLLTIILFGIEFPLFFMGVRSEGSFIATRIKGIFRFLIGLMTFPLLIFDLPILIKKRSFKELITGSRLQFKKSNMRYTAILIKTPLLLIILILSPLVFFLDGLVPPMTIEKVVSNKKEDKKKKIYAPLPSLEIQIPVNDQELLFIPELKVTKKRVTSSLLVIDEKSQTKGKIIFEQDYKYENLITIIKKLDPLLAYHSNVMATTDDRQLAAYQKEVVELMEDIISFDVYNLHSFFLKRGPFIYPYLKVRSEILTKSKFLPGLNFISYSNNQKNLLNSNNNKIILFTDHGFKQLDITPIGKNKKITRTIFRNFLLESKKLEDINISYSKNISGFEIYDIFWKISYDQLEKDAILNEQIILYLLKISLDAIDKNKEFEQKEIKRFLSQIDKLFLSLDKDRQKSFKDVRLVTNRIQVALDKKDTKFFKINIRNNQRTLDKKYKKVKKNVKRKNKPTN